MSLTGWKNKGHCAKCGFWVYSSNAGCGFVGLRIWCIQEEVIVWNDPDVTHINMAVLMERVSQCMIHTNMEETPFRNATYSSCGVFATLVFFRLLLYNRFEEDAQDGRDGEKYQ